jgi:hypothetical protein
MCNTDERMHDPPKQKKTVKFLIKTNKVLHQMGWDLFAPYC